MDARRIQDPTDPCSQCLCACCPVLCHDHALPASAFVLCGQHTDWTPSSPVSDSLRHCPCRFYHQFSSSLHRYSGLYRNAPDRTGNSRGHLCHDSDLSLPVCPHQQISLGYSYFPGAAACYVLCGHRGRHGISFQHGFRAFCRCRNDPSAAREYHSDDSSNPAYGSGKTAEGA